MYKCDIDDELCKWLIDNKPDWCYYNIGSLPKKHELALIRYELCRYYQFPHRCLGLVMRSEQDLIQKIRPTESTSNEINLKDLKLDKYIYYKLSFYVDLTYPNVETSDRFCQIIRYRFGSPKGKTLTSREDFKYKKIFYPNNLPDEFKTTHKLPDSITDSKEVLRINTSITQDELDDADNKLHTEHWPEYPSLPFLKIPSYKRSIRLKDWSLNEEFNHSVCLITTPDSKKYYESLVESKKNGKIIELYVNPFGRGNLGDSFREILKEEFKSSGLKKTDLRGSRTKANDLKCLSAFKLYQYFSKPGYSIDKTIEDIFYFFNSHCDESDRICETKERFKELLKGRNSPNGADNFQGGESLAEDFKIFTEKYLKKEFLPSYSR